MMQTDYPARDLILAGGGHSHLPLLRRLAMRPIPGYRVTLVSRDIHTPYSGMVPGLVAGHYLPEHCHFDLYRLASRAGVRFVHAEVNGIDAGARQLFLAGDRPALSYDLLSLDIGSRPAVAAIAGADAWGVAAKPVETLLQAWHTFRQQRLDAQRPVAITCVGGGAASVELLLAMQYRLHRDGERSAVFRLVCATEELLPGYSEGARRRVTRVLERRGVVIQLGARVDAIEPHAVLLASGERMASAFTVLAVDAAAPTWLAGGGLATDERGFVLVDRQLRSRSHPDVYAAGDIAHFAAQPLPKAGVYAVRQGPVLCDNLYRAATGRPGRPYQPQRRFLSLLSTGNQSAIANRAGWSAGGRWWWLYKNHVDTGFMRRFQVPDAPPPATPMRCGGCGAKVAGGVLADTLARLQPGGPRPSPLAPGVGDDAALIEFGTGPAWVQSVDYIRDFIADPFLLGRIGSLHCLSDIYAMGAQPHSAQVIATMGFGGERLVARDLGALMAGVAQTLVEEGVQLVGGHSSEGAEPGFGMVANGLVPPGGPIAKGPLRSGQALLLTKPLGLGVMLAAGQSAQCDGDTLSRGLAQMLLSNRHALAVLRQFDLQHCTDVTGFGLAGHLAEMLAGAEVSVQLDLDSVPLLEGVPELSSRGFQSSLLAANMAAAAMIHHPQPTHPCWPLLFDPQTSGGLLAAIPADQAEQCRERLCDIGHQAAIIGYTRDNHPGTIELAL